MEIKNLRIYSDFLGHIEYPAVIFCHDGEVLSINNTATRIIGSKVSSITLVPDKFMSSDEFWPELESRKSIIWHRLLLTVNKKDKYVVSGFVNQFDYNGKKAYFVLFELRSDVTIGSVSLERIVNHVGMVALYLYKPDGIWTTRYVSKNISEYGYKDGDFYKGVVGLSDILVKTDYDILIGNIYKASSSHKDDFQMRARLVAKDNSIRKTELKAHLVRTTDGDVDGIEFLFIKKDVSNFSEEENEYLMSAMNNIKSFIMVSGYDKFGSKLLYVTPNAKTLGINSEALQKGNRLIQDYIHPDDRPGYMSRITDAIKSGVTDYEENFRMVDDNGNVRWVMTKNSVTQNENGTYIIESFITDITDKKKLEESVVNAKKEFEDKLSYIMKAGGAGDEHNIDWDNWSGLVKAFADISGLYSVIIDGEGKPLTEPAGPGAHFGEFYDLFEQPAYRQIYMELNEIILQNNVPVMMEMDDGNPDSRICGAPIRIKDKHLGTWIVCAYDAHDVKQMEHIMESHWNLASMFSDYLYNTEVLSKEALRYRTVEMMMVDRIERQRLINKALNSMSQDKTEVINELLKDTGESLGVDVAVIYNRDEDGRYVCEYFWTGYGTMTADEYISKWKDGDTQNPNRMIEEDVLIVDSNHPNNPMQKGMENKHIRSFIGKPIKNDGKVTGCIVYASLKNDKIWEQTDIDYVADVRDAASGIIARNERDGVIYVANRQLVDTYNFLSVGIFIKDKETGEVLFSNHALNSMLGYDFTGKDSKTLIPDMDNKFKGMGMMKNPYLSDKKEIGWRSYIRQFDKIMDLAELKVIWTDGRKASLIILRDVKE